jgi:serine/threonine protein kinase/tetratricopeptide (TPR) repeat protein
VNEETIFLQALERQTPAEQQLYLDAACADDLELRRRVEGLLRLHEQAGRCLEDPTITMEAGASPTSAKAFVRFPMSADGGVINAVAAPTRAEQLAKMPDDDLTGVFVDRYQLIRVLGEGGMGTVYLAEQSEPVRRKVALKVIKRGLDSAYIIARFEAERQALALMEHPHIARILDAGFVTSGFERRPYFVMELVEGRPITKYCADRGLSLRERLELFLLVCRAVQHAHQKGVIHRDLKPSNVLVTELDGRPAPKVIDFGLVKALQHPLTDKTLETGIGSVLGTPEYMSPEQAGLNPVDVDTRSDVYSLGVLLYELLTGRLPVSRGDQDGAEFLEILRRVREEEPRRPSLQVSDRSLAEEIRGELDWITCKALDKDRNRRYDTANALADDVQRHLTGDPVLAGPASGWYRFSKFARKHKVAIATGVAFIVMMSSLSALSIRQAAIASLAREDALRQRERAEKRLRLATEAGGIYLDSVTEDEELKKSDFSGLRKRLLESAIPFYERLVEEHPGDADQEAMRGRALARLAGIHYETGAHERARALFEQKLAVFQRLAKSSPDNLVYRREVALAHVNLGLVLRQLGRRDEARDAYRRAVPFYEQLVRREPDNGGFREDLAMAQNNLAKLLTDLGDLDGAKRLLGSACDSYEWLTRRFPNNGQYSESWARSLEQLGSVLMRAGDSAGAEPVLERSLTLRRKLADQPQAPADLRRGLAATCNTIGILRFGRQDFAGAREAHAEALKLRSQLVAEFPSVPGYRQEQAASHNNLGLCFREEKDLPAALQHLQASGTIKQKLVDDYPNVPDYRQELTLGQTALGAILQELGEHESARQSFEAALRNQQDLVQDFPGSPEYQKDLVICWLNLGMDLERTEDFDESHTAYQRAVAAADDLVEQFPQPAAYRVFQGVAHCQLGGCLKQKKLWDAALAVYDRAIEILSRARLEPGYADPRKTLRNTYREKAQVLHELDRHEEAAGCWEQAIGLSRESERASIRNEWAGVLLRHGLCEAAAAQAELVAQTPELIPGQLVDAAGILALVAAELNSADQSQAAQGERYAIRSIEVLRKALANGVFNDPAIKDHFQANPDFDILREREDFRALLAELP